jgi:hypothetical protein
MKGGALIVIVSIFHGLPSVALEQCFHVAVYVECANVNT